MQKLPTWRPAAGSNNLAEHLRSVCRLLTLAGCLIYLLPRLWAALKQQSICARPSGCCSSAARWARSWRRWLAWEVRALRRGGRPAWAEEGLVPAPWNGQHCALRPPAHTHMGSCKAYKPPEGACVRGKGQPCPSAALGPPPPPLVKGPPPAPNPKPPGVRPAPSCRRAHHDHGPEGGYGSKDPQGAGAGGGCPAGARQLPFCGTKLQPSPAACHRHSGQHPPTLLTICVCL